MLDTVLWLIELTSAKFSSLLTKQSSIALDLVLVLLKKSLIGKKSLLFYSILCSSSIFAGIDCVSSIFILVFEILLHFWLHYFYGACLHLSLISRDYAFNTPIFAVQVRILKLLIFLLSVSTTVLISDFPRAITYLSAIATH